MDEQQRATTFDVGSFRRAVEHNDAELLASLYSEEAELRITNRRNPPSSPFVLRGRATIAEYLRDVYGRDTEHRVQGEVVGDGRLAFTVCCEYQDGSRALAATTIEVRAGKVIREVSVEVWDD